MKKYLLLFLLLFSSLTVSAGFFNELFTGELKNRITGYATTPTTCLTYTTQSDCGGDKYGVGPCVWSREITPNACRCSTTTSSGDVDGNRVVDATEKFAKLILNEQYP